MNFDFGMNFGVKAGEHFSSGEYISGALYLLGGIGDAILDTAAIAGGAQLLKAGVNFVTYMASVEGRLMATMATTHVIDKTRNASWDFLNSAPSVVNNIQSINYVGMAWADTGAGASPYPNWVHMSKPSYSIPFFSRVIDSYFYLTGNISSAVDRIMNNSKNRHR